MTRLAGKVAWITGAGSGIGRAAAIALAQEGASIVLTGRRRDALEATAALLENPLAGAVEPGDVTHADAMQQVMARVRARFGRLDIMVNNAGTNIAMRRWSELAPSGLDHVVATNLSSAFYGVIAALPLMRDQRDGLFIHIGSRAGRYWDGPSGPAYIAAKSALTAMSHSLNAEECLNGIRSTMLHPGETATPILLNRPQKVTEEELARILKPEDCAELIRFIACLPSHVCMNEVVLTPTWNRVFAAQQRK